MKNWLKKIFVPHHHNHFRPHLFRRAGVFVILFIILVTFVFAISSSWIFRKTDFLALVLPKVLVDYTNEERLKENFGQLAVNTTLEKAAKMKANDMATKGYFAHKSPEGKTPWYWFSEAGYEFAFAGENLAVNFSDSVDVNKAWMNSPTHKANILNKNFSEVGIATAEGIYQGRPTTFVVQMFGKPAKKEAISTTSTTTIVSKKPLPVTLKSTTTLVTETKTILSLGNESQSEMFVAVERVSEVAGTSTEVIKQSSFLERLVLSPKRVLSLTYLLVAMVLLIGLSFILFSQWEKHHRKMTILASLLLITLIVLLYVYKSIILEPLLVI